MDCRILLVVPLGIALTALALICSMGGAFVVCACWPFGKQGALRGFEVMFWITLLVFGAMGFGFAVCWIYGFLGVDPLVKIEG